MAKTITQLPDATSVNSTDEMIVQQSGITKKATVAEVMAGGAASLPAGTVVSGSSASAALKIKQSGAGDALLVEDDPANPDSTPLVVNASGQIVSGATAAFDSNAGLQLTADSNTAPNGVIFTQRCGVSSGNVTITIAKTYGTNASKAAITDASHSIGSLAFAGYDGSEYRQAARITCQTDAACGASDMPGRLTFFTTADGAATVTERMRIDSAGNVGIGTTANAAAILDVASTTKGFLPPRMTGAQRNAISTPPAGLMVYVTDAGPGGTTGKLNFYNGTAWEAVTSA